MQHGGGGHDASRYERTDPDVSEVATPRPASAPLMRVESRFRTQHRPAPPIDTASTLDNAPTLTWRSNPATPPPTRKQGAEAPWWLWALLGAALGALAGYPIFL